MNSYHLSLTNANDHYVVHLTPSQKPNSPLTINGKTYSVVGNRDGTAWLKEKINTLQFTEFKSVESFKAAVLSAEKTSPTALKILNISIETDFAPRQKLQLATKHAMVIGKGLHAIHEKGMRGRSIDLEYAKEVTGMRTNPRLLWQDDQTSLSFPEWKTEQEALWKQSGSKEPFNVWMSHRHYEKSGSTDTFQTWELKRLKRWNEEKGGFKAWHKEDDEFRHDLWKRELPNLTFGKFNDLFTEYVMISSRLSIRDFEKLKRCEEKGSKGDFTTFASKEHWKEEVDKKKTKTASYDEWLKEKEDKLLKRWEDSGLRAAGMPYDTWKAQQDSTSLNVDKAFIRLKPEERHFYQLEFNGGTISRNAKPYCTDSETTLHSGDGYAIFVAGPDGKFYAGSHIGNVFHHSSFLADGAIMAAGEIKTNLQGEPTYISSKSGHYKPGDEENLVLLRLLKHKGVDLSKATFSCYSKEGKTQQFPDAAKYLEKLETAEAKRNTLKISLTAPDAKIAFVFNEKGESFAAGPAILEVFDHAPTTNRKIEGLEWKIKHFNGEIEDLKTSKRHKRNHVSRETKFKVADEKIAEAEKQIAALKAFNPGRQDIKGGGVIQTDNRGKIVSLDARIGEQPLSKDEVRFTLGNLRQRNVELDKVQLTVYDGKKAETVNAWEWWKRK